ncbi:MAG: (2Fe-2S)-binding protein [Nitrospirae bacterium]|nr:(2Fe-2S)-binding protein [Nitrospirota bacterium]
MLLLNIKTAPDSVTVCYCNDVALGEIRRAIISGAATLDDIQEATGACTGNRCEEMNPSGGCCETDIMKILAAYGKTGGAGCGCCK